MAMITRGTDEYEDACDVLDLDSAKDYTIPREVLRLPGDVLTKLQTVLKGMTPHNISRILCAYRTPRAQVRDVTDIPYSAYYRAYFITSHTPIKRSDIVARGQNRCLRLYGGRCIQLVSHWHYFFVLEYACREKDVQCLVSCSIQGIATNTEACFNYINAQLAERPINSYIPGYNDAEWYSPYSGDNSLKDVRNTNNVGLYSGTFTNTLPRMALGIVPVSKFKDYVYSVFFTSYDKGKFKNIRKYKGEYNVDVTCGLPAGFIKQQMELLEEFNQVRCVRVHEPTIDQIVSQEVVIVNSRQSL